MGETPIVFPAAGPVRRGSSLALDLALLLAGLVGAVVFGLAVEDAAVVGTLAAVWLLVVAPLYFALYHGRSTGRTPGEREAGVSLLDADTGAPIGMRRALARAYGGLLAMLLVLPLAVDLVVLLGSSDRRPLHDRLLRTRSVALARDRRALDPLPPTAEPVLELFEPAAPGRCVSRARRLVASYRRAIAGATAAAYAALVLLAAVLAPLLVDDFSEDVLDTLLVWILYAVALFASGIFWTQAAVVVSVEAVRVGERPLGLGELLRRAWSRANGLTVALLLLVPLVALSVFTLVGTLLLAPFAVVVPAILLEDRPVLAAFGRSWSLCRGRVARAVGLLLASALAFAATAGVACALAVTVAAHVVGAAGPLAFALACALALVAATVPVGAVLAVFGSAWCLFYYDARRAAASGG